MEDIEKNDPVSGDIEELETELGQDGETEEADTVCGGNPPSRRELWQKRLPYIAIYARYLLPVLTGVLLLAFSFFDWVYFFMEGEPYKMSLFAFYKNTLTSALEYAGGKTAMQSNWFYGLLSVGAIVGILIFVLALFLAVLAAITAYRAFRAGHESEESNRMKVIFKIAFPNRICLFLSNALFLVTVLYPSCFSAIGRQFLLIGNEGTVYIDTNISFIVTLGLTLITLALSFLINRFERQKKMNMFLVWYPDEEAPLDDDDDGEEDSEEDT